MIAPSDTPSSVALNSAAPAEERYDAQVEMHRSGLPALLPSKEVAEVVDYINASFAEQEMAKAIKDNIVPFPPKNRGEPGMQSVIIDDFQVTSQGEYWDRPGILGFDSMRAMVESTPILNAIILTRIRQVQRFCRPQMSQADAGFVIAHVDRNVELSEDQNKSIQLLQHFMLNCGWEADPRRRKRLKRDTLSQFMAKSVRDSLTLDAAGIETEWKRDTNLGIDGFYAVDGGSIRLCTEDGYQGDDEIFALQVVQGRIRTAYTVEDLIYEPRNPRSDVTACGYGYSETEMLIRVVTYLLNTMTYNGSYFDKNSIPKGILHLCGNYDQNDLASFKRYWNAMVKGIQNAWTVPVLVSKDQESKAAFETVGNEINEMMFAKWMSFLTSIACAIYGISPEEIAMESFAAAKSSLSGSDTEERITSSNDKGLRPLLAYYENLFSDWIIQSFSPNYMFRFVGLESEDEDKRHEIEKLVSTVNEGRRKLGMEKMDGPLGDAPLNPALLGVWQQVEGIGQPEGQAGEQEDFGQPPEEDSQGGDQAAEEQPKDFGEADDDGGKDFGTPGDAAEGEETVTKSFGFPDLNIFKVTP